MIIPEGLDLSSVPPEYLFVELYNAAKPLGWGIHHYDPAVMNLEEAREACDNMRRSTIGLYFDYFSGRPIKVNLERFPLDLSLYDRDHGAGEGWKAVYRGIMRWVADDDA